MSEGESNVVDNLNALTDLQPGERMDALMVLGFVEHAEALPWYRFRLKRELRNRAAEVATRVLEQWRERHG